MQLQRLRAAACAAALTILALNIVLVTSNVRSAARLLRGSSPVDDSAAVAPLAAALTTLQRLSYWGQGRRARHTHFPRARDDRYVTFEPDYGGFNNVRLSFEYIVLQSLLTGRTLVLPPPCAWYLLDHGPMKRGVKVHHGVSRYSEFWDIDALRRNVVPVITTAEFIRREQARLGISSSVVASVSAYSDANDKHTQWKEFLQNSAAARSVPWDPSSNVVLYPSEAAVRRRGTLCPACGYEGSRTARDYATPKFRDVVVLHFPMLRRQGCRYLAQIASAVAFASADAAIAARTVMRDGVRYRGAIFAAAAAAIDRLGGLFSYSALHVRRNDLQYKGSFVAADATAANVAPLLRRNESVYIATDETAAAFFAPLEEQRGVKRWHNIAGAMDASGALAEAGPKANGLIEQIVCAGGRVFFGTHSSTFTAYIQRLRGYVGAPDLGLYYHDTPASEADGQRLLRVPLSTSFMREFPLTWESVEQAHARDREKKKKKKKKADGGGSGGTKKIAVPGFGGAVSAEMAEYGFE